MVSNTWNFATRCRKVQIQIIMAYSLNGSTVPYVLQDPQYEIIKVQKIKQLKRAYPILPYGAVYQLHFPCYLGVAHFQEIGQPN